jgi:hypothetical protein
MSFSLDGNGNIPVNQKMISPGDDDANNCKRVLPQYGYQRVVDAATAPVLVSAAPCAFGGINVCAVGAAGSLVYVFDTSDAATTDAATNLIGVVKGDELGPNAFGFNTKVGLCVGATDANIEFTVCASIVQ